jgi:hypothetical protein
MQRRKGKQTHTFVYLAIDNVYTCGLDLCFVLGLDASGCNRGNRLFHRSTRQVFYPHIYLYWIDIFKHKTDLIKIQRKSDCMLWSYRKRYGYAFPDCIDIVYSNEVVYEMMNLTGASVDLGNRIGWIDICKAITICFIYFEHWNTDNLRSFAYSFHLQLFFILWEKHNGIVGIGIHGQELYHSGFHSHV